MGCGHSSQKAPSETVVSPAAKRTPDNAAAGGPALPASDVIISASPQQHDPAGAAERVVQTSDDSGSSAGTPPQGWHAGKPPRSRRRTKAQLETLQEPTNGSVPIQANKASDSAGSGNIRPLKALFPPSDVAAGSPPPAPSAGAGTLPASVPAPVPEAASGAAAASAAADKPPAELAHVLSLLSRLLSASAVLVDLHDPPATFIKDSTELRSTDAREAAGLRRSSGYQEVALVGRSGARLGTLGASVPGGGATPSPMLTQMAGVVVREVETLQAVHGVQRDPAAGAAEGRPAAQEPEWRPPALPAVVLVDVTDGEWRTLAVEDGIEAVTATSAEGWKGVSIWEHLHAPFGKQSSAWRAVNEVAAALGDLIITGVGCRADPSRGPLVLRCTPANAALLAAQARPQEWMDALDAAQHSRPSTDSIETAETSADVMAETAQAFASGQGAVAVAQQRQRLSYLVTVARQSPLGFPRAATDSGRWVSQGSSSLDRTGGSGGQLSEEGAQGVPIDGVQLGPMLGKGSYGRVYHGYWQGTEVAIKVCTQGIARSGDRTVKPWAGVEAVASLGLHHPGVMRTLNHTTVVVPAPPSRGTVRHPSLHLPDVSPSGGVQHGPRASFDLGASGRTGAAPSMVRSASSDMDGSQNTSHGTQLARPFPIAVLRSGDSSTGGSGGRGPPLMPPAILSPFAAPSAAAAPAPVPALGSGPPSFSPFADARKAVQEPPPGGSSSGSGGTASAGNSGERADTGAEGGRGSPPGNGAPVQALRGSSLGLPDSLGAGSLRGVVPEQQAEVDTWVVMEYCNRGTLQRALEDGLFSMEDEAGNRQPNMTAVLAAAKQLAAAMAYMHERGVIHGDLSRANILLTDSEGSPSGFDVKVADFGMARQLDVQSRIDTFSCGTITHTAPELMDEGHLSRAADVFAAGVLMWELWNGGGAWSGMNQAQIISAVLIHNKRPTFPPEAPKDYADLARKCMSTLPKERPTFTQIEQRVDAMLRETGTTSGVQ